MRGVRLHALAQLAYEGIMDDLAVGGGVDTNAAPASAKRSNSYYDAYSASSASFLFAAAAFCAIC